MCYKKRERESQRERESLTIVFPQGELLMSCHNNWSTKYQHSKIIEYERLTLIRKKTIRIKAINIAVNVTQVMKNQSFWDLLFTCTLYKNK